MSLNAPLAQEDGISVFDAGYYESPDGYAKDIELDPENGSRYIRHAKYLQKIGRTKEGLANAEKAVKLLPQSVDAWTCLAKAQHASLLAFYQFPKLTCPLAVWSISRKHRLLQETTVLKTESAPKPPDVRPPWERAGSILEGLKHTTINTTTSASVIYFAHRTFNQAAEVICEGDADQWKMLPYPPGLHTPALHGILEGIMRDPRCFQDRPDIDLTDMLYAQSLMELEATDGWDSDCSLDQVQRELRDRVREKGWHSVKPALRCSIQDWILFGFQVHQIEDHNPVNGLKFYKKAIAMIDFVRKTWPDVPAGDRGVVCENSFLFPLKRLALRAYLDPKHSNRSSDKHLTELEGFASTLVKEAEAELAGLDQRGIASPEGLSYWIYPIAEGYAALAWVHCRRGDRLQLPSPHFIDAFDKYLRAAVKLDEDEEYHAYFLCLAIDSMWRGGVPLKLILPSCERVRGAAPKMRKIWENSRLSATRDARILQVLEFEDEYKRKIKMGEASPEDVAVPKNWASASENDDEVIV
ncbi:hypothetical protein PENSPDRAFT_687969 [Peniophora sp. CONT]|nr:hypothetical protein PENSPDRAFT_687969 [Peniophora sp. CONT]